MTRAQRSENTGIARQGTIFSFGLTCSNHMNVPKAKKVVRVRREAER